jgi:hypothetical protein
MMVMKLLICTNCKQISDFTLCFSECQSLYFGDDLEYYDDLSDDAASLGFSAYGYWDW